MSCGCCRRPRYQRLIDGIFSTEPDGELNQRNLQQLLYLSRASPDKVDDIGKYLHLKLRRFVRGNRLNLCRQCLSAVEALLAQSGPRTISLVVRNFLPMSETLLEPSNEEMQRMAMDTLLKFTEYPEDRPTYQPEYDFIIERLTSLAFPNSSSNEIRKKAISCLIGLVKKVSRDKFTQVMLWEDVHLNKLVPAYLFQMKDNPEEDLISAFAETAKITQLVKLMASIFEHFDLNHSWISDAPFVHSIMEAVVKSAEAKKGQTIIVETLLDHLNKHARNVLISTVIVQVLDKVVAMTAGNMSGPYLLDFLNKLVSHIKTNISLSYSSSENKATLEKFQNQLVKVIMSCGECVPNYERWHIVCFLIGQLPDQVAVETDTKLSIELMRMCSRVMGSIRMRALDDIFTDQVYTAFRGLWKYTSPELVPLVLLLWTQAMDWQGNSKKVPLTTTWSSPEDERLTCVNHAQYIFNNKYLEEFSTSLSDYVRCLPWERPPMEAFYRFITMVPLSLGAEAGKALVKVAMEIQDGGRSSARDSRTSSPFCKQFCHVSVAGLLHMLSAMLPGSLTWNVHIAEVLDRRSAEARHLLPDGFFLGTDMLNVREGKEDIAPELLFESQKLQMQGLHGLSRLPSISVYDTDRADPTTTQSVVLLSTPPGGVPFLSFQDMREGQGIVIEENTSPQDQDQSFQEALTKDSLVHQRIADMLTSPILTADDFGTETIELPQIH